MTKHIVNRYYRQKLKKSIRQMAVWILIASIIWTVFSIYSALNKAAEISIDKEILNPISIKFDVDTLKQLEQRQKLPKNINWLDNEASSSSR